jgi:L-lactate dehydrogenase complex protein LldG
VVEGAFVSDDARSAILGRVRRALADVPADEPPVASVPTAAPWPPADAAAVADRFAERVADYRATVTRCGPDDVAAVVADLCTRHGARRLASPAELPPEWLPSALETLRDEPPLPVAELDAVDAVITGSAAGIAETGTIVLDGGPLSGRRALTLVPDLHICVVRSSDLVAGVPEGMSALEHAVRAGRPITLVSGPSATSDIELDRVEGVHGPRRLEVVLVDG